MSPILQDSELQSALAFIQAQFAAEVDDNKIPALSASIVYGGEVLWRGGFGTANVAADSPADEKTVYRIASITKLFTATALMRLRDAGKLSLDDPITKHLPEFRIRDAHSDGSVIRLKHLVSHTSGIPREPYLDHWLTGRAQSFGEMLASVANEEMLHPPSTKFRYSNIAVGMVGEVIARASGMPFEAYIERNVLQPLGMSMTAFSLSDEMKRHLATGYIREEKDAELEPVEEWHLGGLAAGGGMYSTVEDMAKFIAFQFEGKADVLAPGSVREMRQPVHAKGADSYGVAWSLSSQEGVSTVGHGGALYGFRTHLLLAPEKRLGVAVFVNIAHNPFGGASRALRHLIPVIERAEARVNEPPSRPEPPSSSERYVGKYRWRGFGDLWVSVHHNALVAHDEEFPKDNDPALEFDVEDDAGHWFRVRGGASDGERARFDMDANGVAHRLWIGAYPYDRRDTNQAGGKNH